MSPVRTSTALGKLAEGVGNLGLREVEIPPPGPHQALVRVTATGVCGTDLHIADDEFPNEPPVTMGHEVTGVVEEVGSGPDSGWVGKRVSLETYFSTCEACEYCRGGKPNLCASRRSIGSKENGGFAGWIVVPTHNLWELPSGVGDIGGALAEPLACVAECLLDPPVIGAGDRVLVTGPGTMGLITAQVARACGGVVTVAGIDRDAERLALAESMGLGVLTLGTEPPEIEPLDVVCECSGAEPAAALALDLVKKGGRYVQVGIFGKPVTLPLDNVLYKELVVSSGNASTPTSWKRAMALIESGL
ncbi:MAG: alcohol dehydrogenase catalytic domain-containing protein, partial [Acidimicrobiia bacterium]|nr:alcohol dehydrogenase catalytic domain-containing protein [Acidimicrobiia bacterium]